VDVVTAEYNAIDEQRTITQTSFAIIEDLLTLLKDLASSSAPSSGGDGYMGQIADAWARVESRLAQVVADEEQTRMKVDMSRCEFGDL
jgi:hypothetical protein